MRACVPLSFLCVSVVCLFDVKVRLCSSSDPTHLFSLAPQMAERACWRQQQQQQQQWGAISPGGWRSGLAFAPAEEEAPAVAMGAVYGRGYQSGRVVGKEKEKERGASPSTRSTGSTVDEDEEEAVVGPSDVEEEEEGEERMLVGEENDAEESEGEEGTLLLLKPGRRRARSTGRYRIVV